MHCFFYEFASISNVHDSLRHNKHIRFIPQFVLILKATLNDTH